MGSGSEPPYPPPVVLPSVAVGSENPDLSVIVPVFNGASTIEPQLEALLRQSWDRPFEILVVDNDSDDDTQLIVERVSRSNPRLRLTSAPRFHNLSYVRNVGVREALAPAVAFADADDVVGDGWVAAIGRALDEHPLVGSRLEYEYLNPGSDAGRSAFQSREISTFHGLPNLAGAGLGCRVELWERLGGNNESWDDTGEDFEFSFRAFLEAGIRPVFVPGALYHYRRRNAGKAAFRQARRYGRSHARLAATFGHAFSDWPRPVEGLRADLWLLLHLDRAVRPSTRVDWMWKMGKRLGRLEGSLRYKTLFL